MCGPNARFGRVGGGGKDVADPTVQWCKRARGRGGGSRTFRPWLPCRRAGADSAAASLAETGSISTFSSDIFSLLLTLVCGAHQGGKSGRKGGPPCWRRRVREEEYHGGAALPGRPACSRETGRREPHTALTQSSAGTLDS